jgi:hypothetical protein
MAGWRDRRPCRSHFGRYPVAAGSTEAPNDDRHNAGQSQDSGRPPHSRTSPGKRTSSGKRTSLG